MVDQTSRAIDSQLNFQRRHQGNFFGVAVHPDERNEEPHSRGHIQENIQTPEDGKVFLSSSLHGSPRHLRKLANEALCVVSELGVPTLFITATCNPKWDEIQSQLLQGQTAFDRPDICNMVSDCQYGAILTKFSGTFTRLISVVSVVSPSA
jgi:hypothetical protein